MMATPTVSIIVPTFNRAHYLPECLDSLVTQTVPPLEIIVVDDGSEDGTKEVVTRYGPPVRYVHKENGGKPSAVNLALKQCRGDLIWLFDDDDVALPDAIKHRLEALAKKPEAGFVYSAHYLGTDGDGGKIRRCKLYTPPTPSGESFFLAIMKGCFFHLNSALVKRELYQAAGEFDGQLRTGEDYDMQIRLARLSRPAFSCKPSFVFRQHQGARGDKSARFDGAQRRQVFLTYSAVLGRKIRDSVFLEEFSFTQRASVTEKQLARTCLLNRLQVMANFGCIPEMFSDTLLLLQHASVDISPLTKSERQGITDALCIGFAYEAAISEWEDSLSRITALKEVKGGRQAIACFCKGILRLAKSHPGTILERLDRIYHAFRIFHRGL